MGTFSRFFHASKIIFHNTLLNSSIISHHFTKMSKKLTIRISHSALLISKNLTKSPFYTIKTPIFSKNAKNHTYPFLQGWKCKFRIFHPPTHPSSVHHTSNLPSSVTHFLHNKKPPFRVAFISYMIYFTHSGMVGHRSLC